MNISTNSLANFNGYHAWKAKQEEEDPLCFNRAIETWSKQVLTGATLLTDEEKELIRERIAAWFEENTLKTDDDEIAFRMFIKDLYAAFGARDDFFDFVAEEIKALWIEENTLATDGHKEKFMEFVKRLNSVLDEFNIANRANIAPSRLIPLQYQLQGASHDS